MRTLEKKTRPKGDKPGEDEPKPPPAPNTQPPEPDVPDENDDLEPLVKPVIT
jgi:hypothetical protein